MKLKIWVFQCKIKTKKNNKFYMKLSAVIFDLDGTVINSNEAWGKAFVNVLSTFGVKPETMSPHSTGISVRNNWKNLVTKYNIKTEKTPEDLETLTYVEYEKLIPTVTLNDGAIDLIDNLKDNNLPVALATSTKWEVVDKILDRFGMSDLFDIVTTGEEVINPKPDPDIFTLTADKLGIDREDCLVIEDSESGIMAAQQAGMRVVAVVDDDNLTPEIEKADKVVERFSEIKLKELELLF